LQRGPVKNLPETTHAIGFLLPQLSFLLHISIVMWKDSHGKVAHKSLVLSIHSIHVIDKQALHLCQVAH